MLAYKLKSLPAACAVGLLLAVGSTGASAQSAYCDGVARDYASRNAHGGGVGAVGGAANQSQRWESLYLHAYNDCLARSAPAPAPVYGAPVYGSPEPWTDAWYDYCHAKYRSFNPNTGMFLAYSGEYTLCR